MQRNERLPYIIIIFAIILVGAAMWAVFYPRTKTASVYVGGTVIKAKVAKNNLQRNNLLHKSESLEENSGVLVDYGDEEKDSRLVSANILSQKTDILWLDENQKVIYQAKEIPRMKTSKEIGPKMPARYLFFLQSGEINKYRIKYGDKVEFNLNSLLW